MFLNPESQHNLFLVQPTIYNIPDSFLKQWRTLSQCCMPPVSISSVSFDGIMVSWLKTTNYNIGPYLLVVVWLVGLSNVGELTGVSILGEVREGNVLVMSYNGVHN